jgi:pimeloyl-ACP methyl ester carboxylesterase
MPENITLRGADDLRLVADAYGDVDAPPALLLHGLGQTRQSWGVAAARLGEQGWRAYALDHRGHGDSDKSRVGAYDHAHIAADVIAICEALGRRPLLVGASLGGVAALFAQGTCTEQLFRGLVLVDITPDIDMDGARRIISFMALNPDGYANLDDAAEAIAAYRSGTGKPSPRGLSRVLRQGNDGRWRWHWDSRLLDTRKRWLTDPKAADAYRVETRTGMVAGIRKLSVPTMLVRGGSSDVVTLKAAKDLLALLPRAQFVDVADASHMVAGDRNDAFSNVLLDFALTLLAEESATRRSQP